MSDRAAAASRPAVLPRGVYAEWFHGWRVYFAVTSTGARLNTVGVPIADETDDDVIVRLADALAACDPLPRGVPDELAGLRAGRPVLRLLAPARRRSLAL